MEPIQGFADRNRIARRHGRPSRRPIRACHGACRMAEHPVAAAYCARLRLPAALQPRVQQLVGRRKPVPHGDPLQGPESGDVEDDVDAVGEEHDDIVRVLVLRDDRRGLPGRLGLRRPTRGRGPGCSSPIRPLACLRAPHRPTAPYAMGSRGCMGTIVVHHARRNGACARNYEGLDTPRGGHAPIRCRNARILPR